MDWNGINKELVLAASFDGSFSILNIPSGKIVTKQQVQAEIQCANEASWNPRDGNAFAVACSQGTIQVYDTRQQVMRPTSILSNDHAGDVLCLDWNKYEPGQIASSGVDQQAKVWDLRNAGRPVVSLSGHYRAVRRVKWSPFSRNKLASCGYDMTVRFWNVDSLVPMDQPAFTGHTEFVLGLSYSLKREGLLASASWDDTVCFHSGK